MTEMKKLVTADAVKSALRTEEVRGTLKESIRKTFEAQIDADVEAILDELTGPAEEASAPQAGDGENTADSPVENSSRRHNPGVRNNRLMFCSRSQQPCCDT